jgi:hypothetical protein
MNIYRQVIASMSTECNCRIRHSSSSCTMMLPPSLHLPAGASFSQVLFHSSPPIAHLAFLPDIYVKFGIIYSRLRTVRGRRDKRRSEVCVRGIQGRLSLCNAMFFRSLVEGGHCLKWSSLYIGPAGSEGRTLCETGCRKQIEPQLLTYHLVVYTPLFFPFIYQCYLQLSRSSLSVYWV